MLLPKQGQFKVGIQEKKNIWRKIIFLENNLLSCLDFNSIVQYCLFLKSIFLHLSVSHTTV